MPWTPALWQETLIGWIFAQLMGLKHKAWRQGEAGACMERIRHSTSRDQGSRTPINGPVPSNGAADSTHSQSLNKTYKWDFHTGTFTKWSLRDRISHLMGLMLIWAVNWWRNSLLEPETLTCTAWKATRRWAALVHFIREVCETLTD